MPRIKLTILLIVILVCRLEGQEIPGMVNGNYQAVNSVLLNPSAPLHGKPWLDVNILGLALYGENTAFYIPGENFSWYDLLNPNYELAKFGKYERPYLLNSGPKLYNFYALERLQLPGFQYIDHNYSFGLQLSVRSALSGRRIPHEMLKFAYYDLGYPPQQFIEYTDYDINGAALNWAEIGLNYGRTIRYERFTIINAGITLKRILATGGAYVHIDNIRYMVENDSTTDIRNLNAEFGLSAPIDYNTNQYDSDLGPFTGSGFGLDLGITYIRTSREIKRMNSDDPPCDWRFIPYDYRLGISIIDWGYASFNDNAQVHTLDNVSHYWDRIDTIGFTTINEALHEISTRFYGDPNRSLSANSFSMGLPAALSVQFDYHLRNNWYINSTWVQGIPAPAGHQVRRTPWLAITPRYETDYFELNIPVSIYDYRSPRLGLSFRIMGLTIGTDKLGTLLGMGDFYGLDVYLSARFSILKGHCPKPDDSTPCGRLDFH